MKPRAVNTLADLLGAWLDDSPVQDSERSADTSPMAMELLSERLSRAARCASLLDAAFSRHAMVKTDVTVPDLTPGVTIPDEDWFLRGIPLGPDGQRRLGRFVIRSWIGGGGMSQVYLAFDPNVGRNVALKLPRYGDTETPRARERFVREARAAGALRHPNIVPVLESGEEDRWCYIASQFCDGPTLAEWRRRQAEPVPCRLAAEIVATLADAMQHAHDRGILHRDLKPGNILLDSAPATMPGSCSHGMFPYIPKVSDFGLAALQMGDPTLTATGTILGTAAYMSPEQAAGDKNAVSVRSDVYSLGIILYELLTGRSPFQRASLVGTLTAVQCDELATIRKLRPETPRDLEAVCLKACARYLADRYASAAELRDDLRRFLEGRPVQVRSASALHRIASWSRRNPAAAALAITLILSVLASIAGVVWHNRRLAAALGVSESLRRRATNAEAEARREGARLQSELYATTIATAHQAWFDGDSRRAHSLLKHYLPSPAASVNPPQGSLSPDTDIRSRHGELRGWEWHFLWNHVAESPLSVRAQAGAAYSVCFSPRGDELIVAGAEGIARGFDARSLAVRQTIATGQREINAVALSRDGRTLLTAGDDGSVVWWNWETGKLTRRCECFPQAAYAALFAKNGEWVIVAGKSNAIQVRESRSGTLLRNFEGHTDDVESLAVSPDGQWLASGSSDKTVKLWRLEDGTLHGNFPISHHRVSSVAFSPDSRALAIANIGGGVYRVPMSEPRVVPWHQERDGVQCIAWSPDSRWLTIGCRSGVVRHLDATAETKSGDDEKRFAKQVAEMAWLAHDHFVYGVAVSPDGQNLASVGNDGLLRVSRPRYLSPSHQGIVIAEPTVWDIALAPSGSELLVLTNNELLSVDLQSGNRRVLGENPGVNSPCLAVSSQRQVVLGGVEGVLFRGSLATLPSWQLWPLGIARDILSARFTPNGRLLLLFVRGGTIELRDSETGVMLRELKVQDEVDFAVSHDSRLLAVGRRNEVLIWDLMSGEIVRRIVGHTSTVYGVAFSSDDALLATTGGDRRVKLWDWREARELWSQESTTGFAESLVFSSDNRTLFSAGAETSVTLWHVATGRSLFSLDQMPRIQKLLVTGPWNLLGGRTRESQFWLLKCGPDGQANSLTAEP